MPLVRVNAIIWIDAPADADEDSIDNLISDVLDRTEQHGKVFDTDIVGWEYEKK